MIYFLFNCNFIVLVHGFTAQTFFTLKNIGFLFKNFQKTFNNLGNKFSGLVVLDGENLEETEGQ